MTGFIKVSEVIKQPDRARHRQARPYLVLALAVLALFGLIRLHSVVRRDSVEGWTLYRRMADQPTPIDQQTSLAFLNRAASDAARFDRLFSYFFHGFVINAGSDFARIHYPGLPSASGYSMSGLEGFARTAPLFAAWLYSGRPQEWTAPHPWTRLLGFFQPVPVSAGRMPLTDPTSSIGALLPIAL